MHFDIGLKSELVLLIFLAIKNLANFIHLPNIDIRFDCKMRHVIYNLSNIYYSTFERRIVYNVYVK